ncbi:MULTISPECIES: carbamate kinase [Comamonadaceae]|uniref:Carbamate kinase n=1 Tax=Alicycliphilus denitrificans (strain DSM 14773 / CIP 107495 / K601) TaxID=596154 RepID=F4G9Y1_ALIDK|nr:MULTISPECIES: carbamate kinase [Comamonadaceae]AEB85713.1 Carbamate kinase [Alicycliphilus denitrificans K601]
MRALETHFVSALTRGADRPAFRLLVVASLKPLSVVGLQPIRWLLSNGALVIAAGGGGIPVAKAADEPGLRGVDAVIDKDLCSSLLARELNVDCLVIATDVDAVYLDFGQPAQCPLRSGVADGARRTAFLPPTQWCPRSKQLARSCGPPDFGR